LGLTTAEEIQLRNISLLKAFEDSPDEWVAIAKESYKYAKAILPHDPKPEDVCDYLTLSLQARDDFVVLKASKKAKEKYWFSFFADLIVDRKWDEIKGGG